MSGTQRRNPFHLPSTSTPDFTLDFKEHIPFMDQIPFEDLLVTDSALGSGTFGTVFRGRWRGQNVAVKQFKTQEEIDSFLVEVKQLSCIKHPNIVTLYGASALKDSAYLVMECSELGSLNFLLHESKQQDYDLRHACSWAMQTARGVAYLHEMRPKPIMHRDLKPANLLLFSRGKVLKICDFGTACTVKTKMTNNTGSASYMAPEVFATSNYLESGDVFSWGIIFWEILARRQPYSQQYSNPYQILWRVKQEGTRPEALADCPDIIWGLITRAWNKDPALRPSMRQVAREMELILSLAEKPSRVSFCSSASSSTLTSKSTPNTPQSQLSPSCSYANDSSFTIFLIIDILKQHKLKEGADSSQLSEILIYGRPLLSKIREILNRKQDNLLRLELIKDRADKLQRARLSNEKIAMWDSIEEFKRVRRLEKFKQNLLKGKRLEKMKKEKEDERQQLSS